MNTRTFKLLSIILALSILFAFASCGSKLFGWIENGDGGNITDPDKGPDGGNGEDPSDASKKSNKIKNIILIIGDGMGKNHIKAGELDRGSKYDFQKWTNTYANTDSVKKSGEWGVLTDSAAAATALATGTLTVNSYVGVDHLGGTLDTIMDHAAAMGKSTGVVTTDALYGATPAGFSAHSNDRNDYSTITSTQLQSGVNFLCGAHNTTYDGADYQSIISNSPYYFTRSLYDENINFKDRIMMLLNIENDAADSVELKDAARVALEYLDRDEDGFVLMIEQAHIDKHSHNNKFAEMLECVHSLGETVDTVIEWIGDRKDTAVIVTADHETGGLSVNLSASSGDPYNGESGTLYYKWGSTGHTSDAVRVFVYGIKPDFALFETYQDETIIKNTDVFLMMKELLDKN